MTYAIHATDHCFHCPRIKEIIDGLPKGEYWKMADCACSQTEYERPGHDDIGKVITFDYKLHIEATY